MRICPKCGAKVDANARFCISCGANISEQINSYNYQPEQKGNTGLIVTIIAVLLVLSILLGVLIFVLLLDRNVETNGQQDIVHMEKTQGSEEKTKNTTVYDVQEVINNYISSNASHSDISVAVVDNRTNTRISSQNSGVRYVAWGFYVPVYMAYKDTYGYVDHLTLERILSSDAGVCNKAANTAIDAIGGLGALNNAIYYNYNCKNTSYGRYFGHSSAYGENYTTADEAVSMIAHFNNHSSKSLLSYNVANYGVTVPSGVTFNAQVGTENNSVRNNMNIFAVVKGQHSDYCVVVLTKNGVGKNNISGLLTVIHTKMEELSR